MRKMKYVSSILNADLPYNTLNTISKYFYKKNLKSNIDIYVCTFYQKNRKTHEVRILMMCKYIKAATISVRE